MMEVGEEEEPVREFRQPIWDSTDVGARDPFLLVTCTAKVQ